MAKPQRDKTSADAKPPQNTPVPLVGEPTGFYDQDKDPDFPAKGKSKRGKKRKSSLVYNLLMLVFGAIFLVSAGLLGKRYWDDYQAQKEFGSLRELISTDTDTDTDAEDIAAATETGETAAESKFAALREQNSDCIGWISIEDTLLDLPVMYKPDSEDFYLRRGFDKQYSVYGVPYIDEKCTFGANRQSENLIIYGHHMKTGTIFGSLHGYEKADYYTEHPYVELDTIYGSATYEVFGAFAIDIVDDQSFLYNQYTDMDEDVYNEYVQKVLARSDVDTGIVPTYGEQLLTLSTCDYSTENGRYVVVARCIERTDT